MRFWWFFVFLVIATPIDIWLDFIAGSRLAGQETLLVRPFAQAAFYLYASAIAAEVTFRISNLSATSGHVGIPLRFLQVSAALLIGYLVADYIQLQRPIINFGGTVENTMRTQLIVAAIAVALSCMTYHFEGRLMRRHAES
jgi:hypothetical protein